MTAGFLLIALVFIAALLAVILSHGSSDDED